MTNSARQILSQDVYYTSAFQSTNGRLLQLSIFEVKLKYDTSALLSLI